MGIFFNASPPLTEKNLDDQTGKVFIVTGATSGIGELLAGILYAKNAQVYVAGRSPEKGEKAIQRLKEKHPESGGDLVFLHLDLDDLSSIKGSAEEFLSKESKLNVLWNNASVMVPPQGSKTKQGYEKQLGTNTLAPFLFTKLLTPVLQQTAKTEPEGSVRVVWVSSSAAAVCSPPNGVDMTNLTYERDESAWHKYGVSKAGNILHAAEYARRHEQDGIYSLSLDPGMLKTPLWDDVSKIKMFFVNFVLKDPVYGAYTELFAGCSRDLKKQDNGRFGTFSCSFALRRVPFQADTCNQFNRSVKLTPRETTLKYQSRQSLTVATALAGSFTIGRKRRWRLTSEIISR